MKRNPWETAGTSSVMLSNLEVGRLLLFFLVDSLGRRRRGSRSGVVGAGGGNAGV